MQHIFHRLGIFKQQQMIYSTLGLVDLPWEADF
jgi:hypothetical protein